jgi:hypothetical protein
MTAPDTDASPTLDHGFGAMSTIKKKTSFANRQQEPWKRWPRRDVPPSWTSEASPPVYFPPIIWRMEAS